MLDFLVSNWLEILIGFVAFVCFVVTFIRTGSITKSLDILKEVFDLKYRTVDTRINEKQSFSDFIKDYILNTATNELEELPIPKNVQDKIQSFIGTSLEFALEKFLPKVKNYDEYCNDLCSVPTEVIADVYQSRVEDMASIAESMELAEKYRQDFGLPDTATYADIYAAIDKKARELKESLNKVREFNPEVKPEVKSEVKEEFKNE